MRERTGEPVSMLQDEADELDAGLIVVAARQRHSLHGRLLGRVPERLLHGCNRPVAVLPRAYIEDRLTTASTDARR